MRQLIRVLSFIIAISVMASFSISNAFAADTNASPMQQLAGSILKDIHQASWVSDGKGPHIVYIFFDPNCPFCHKLYENTRSWVKQGKVTLRWIPVGILTATSDGKAAAILGAKNPLKAFLYNENHYKRGGGIEEALPSSATENKLKRNEKLLARTQDGAVPVMLFRTKDGAPFIIEGAPPKDKLNVILKYLK